jgi:hypothetical protein
LLKLLREPLTDQRDHAALVRTLEAPPEPASHRYRRHRGNGSSGNHGPSIGLVTVGQRRLRRSLSPQVTAAIAVAGEDEEPPQPHLARNPTVSYGSSQALLPENARSDGKA